MFFILQWLFFFFYSLFFPAPQEYVQTVYGSCAVTEPVICELIQSQAFNRLKGVNQYGIVHYIHENKLPYTRHTHSLGVFYLLRHYGASLEEQIAGLLHDASHTVFSHVGDHLVSLDNIDQNEDAYQDEKHLAILARTDIAAILAKHNIPLENINHKCGKFAMLEGNLPDICADRLEYNLYGGLAAGWLTQEEIDQIMHSLHYVNNCWFFDNPVHAKKLADVSIRLCKEQFSSHFNFGSYDATAKALLRAVEIGLISFDDILFMQDDAMLAKLQASSDATIAYHMNNALHAKEFYVSATADSHDLSCTAKFRGINPWIQVGDALMRLTDVDPEFKQRYQKEREDMRNKKYYRVVPYVEAKANI